MTTRTTEGWLLVLQAVDVAFLLLHDWVPLGRLSNRQAVREVDSVTRLAVSTLISTVPWALGLGLCCVYWHSPRWPHWLESYLVVSYCVLLAGALVAWWIPYLVWSNPERAARYRIRFAGTLRFLPERNGIAPDTLHVAFHGMVLATLVLLVRL